MSSVCGSCRAELAPDARFCGVCGTPRREHVRAVLAKGHDERRRTLRAALSLFALCAGNFAALLLGADESVDERGEWRSVLTGESLGLLVGVGAALVAGGFAGTTPLRARVRWLLAAVPAAFVSYLVACSFVFALGFSGDDGAVPISRAEWVGAVVLAPLVEEWMCRGVAWRSAERLARPATALVLTSIVFAFLHGLGGTWLLELPHRFVAGLAFGFLRWRSGSLVPGVLAHALHNGICCGFPG